MRSLAPKKVKSIKKAQKEKLLLKEISRLFADLAMHDDRLHDLWINKVELSPDKGICSVYFFSAEGSTRFNALIDVLKQHKSALRKSLAETIESRYTPDIVFRYDEQYEKVEKINKLLDRIKAE